MSSSSYFPFFKRRQISNPKKIHHPYLFWGPVSSLTAGGKVALVVYLLSPQPPLPQPGSKNPPSFSHPSIKKKTIFPCCQSPIKTKCVFILHVIEDLLRCLAQIFLIGAILFFFCSMKSLLTQKKMIHTSRLRKGLICGSTLCADVFFTGCVATLKGEEMMDANRED